MKSARENAVELSSKKMYENFHEVLETLFSRTWDNGVHDEPHVKAFQHLGLEEESALLRERWRLREEFSATVADKHKQIRAQLFDMTHGRYDDRQNDDFNDFIQFVLTKVSEHLQHDCFCTVAREVLGWWSEIECLDSRLMHVEQQRVVLEKDNLRIRQAVYELLQDVLDRACKPFLPMLGMRASILCGQQLHDCCVEWDHDIFARDLLRKEFQAVVQEKTSFINEVRPGSFFNAIFDAIDKANVLRALERLDIEQGTHRPPGKEVDMDEDHGCCWDDEFEIDFLHGQAKKAKEEALTLVGKASESQAEAMKCMQSSKTLFAKAFEVDIGDEVNTAKEEASTLVGKASESQASAMELLASSKTLFARASKCNGMAMELCGAAVALQSCAWTDVRANKLDVLFRKNEWTSADLRAVNLELQKTPKKAAWISGDLRSLQLDQLFIFGSEVPDASGRGALKPEELLRLDEVSRPLLCLPALLLGANAHD